MEESTPRSVLPRRKSAAKASAAVAGQLLSDEESSGGSEGEVKGGSSAKARAMLGKTYGKRSRTENEAAPSPTSPASGKAHLASRKEESKRSQPKPRPIKKKRETSPSMSLLAPLPWVASPVPSASMGSSSEKTKATEAPKPRPRPRPVANIKATVAQDLSPSPSMVNALAKPDADDEDSDLTSLPSSMHSESSESEVEIVKDITPPSSFPSQLPVPGNVFKHLDSFRDTKRRKKSGWSVDDLGVYVWVLIEPQTCSVFDPEKDASSSEDIIWWPGKITSQSSTDLPLKVMLYQQKTVTISAPSERNILPKLDSVERLRFPKPVFILPSGASGDPSARKKPRYDGDDSDPKYREEVKSKWKAAREEMVQDDADDDDSDDLPPVATMFSRRPRPGLSAKSSGDSHFTNSQPATNGKRKFDETLEDDIVLDEDEWEVPPPDDSLTIPGEVVLGRESGHSASAYRTVLHWPAMILEYIPPKNRKEVAKYRVQWVGESFGFIPRSFFYTMTDEEFATCKLGKIKSNFEEVQNDDENEDIAASQAYWDFSRRSPSPEPIFPLPTETFYDLSVRQQFAYVKPVLQAILMDQYLPVVSIQKLFYAGGGKRASLNKSSDRRGRLDGAEIEEFLHYIKEWCLRKRAERGRRDDLGAEETKMEDTEPLDVDGSTTIADVVEGQQSVEGSVSVVEAPVEALVVEESDGHPRELPSEAAAPELGSAPAEDDPDILLDAGESLSSSPPVTEAVPSSPGEMPSSWVTSAMVLEDDEASAPTLSRVEDGAIDVSLPDEHPSTSEEVTEAASDLMNLDEEDNAVPVIRPPPPRQQGCPNYEVLKDNEKLDYCTLVLLPECIRQALLWRTGVRTSMQLLAQEAEQSLFNEGETLLDERDWVNDVRRARAKAEANYAKKAGNKRRGRVVDYRGQD